MNEVDITLHVYKNYFLAIHVIHCGWILEIDGM